MTGNRGWKSLQTPSHLTPNFLVLTCLAVFTAVACVAQETQTPGPMPLPTAPSGYKTSPAPKEVRIVIPVGTSIPLVLTRYLNSHDIRSGDAVFAQVSNPVMVGDQIAIPAGTFVRGKVQELRRNGTRGELLMRSAALLMGSEVVDMGGPVKIESEEWTAWNNPGGGTKAGIILAPIVGTGLGMAIGAATDKPHTFTLGGGSMPSGGFGGLPGPTVPVPGLTVTEKPHNGLMIGSAVGTGVGLITSLTLLARSHQFYLEEGSPLHLTVQTPVSVTAAQIADAEHNPSPVQVIRTTRPWPGPGNNPPIGFPGSAPATRPGSCPAGKDWCMGSCKDTIDFMNDSSNCGRCGNSCSINESCTGGSCSCAPGYSSCMGSCVSDSSFISDNNNCGSCGHSCSIGESCTGGMCMKQP